MPKAMEEALRLQSLRSGLPAERWELAGVRQVANSSPGPCSDAALCVFRCRRKPVSK